MVTALGVLGAVGIAAIASFDETSGILGFFPVSVGLWIAMALVAGTAVTAVGMALDHLTQRHPAYRVAVIAPIALAHALVFRSDSATLLWFAVVAGEMYWAIFLIELAVVASWRWVRTRR